MHPTHHPCHSHPTHYPHFTCLTILALVSASAVREALSPTQSQHAPHDAGGDTVTKAPLHQAREEQEGDSGNEMDDEVEELIEGRDSVGGAEADGVWSWPDI